jgi:hypothetical protein
MHPFEIGSADVSSPQTTKTGVMARMSAALPAAITSSAMTMQRRKMRISMSHRFRLAGETQEQIRASLAL